MSTAGPLLAGWPLRTGPLAVLGSGRPAWVAKITRQRQADGTTHFYAVAAAARRDEARRDLDKLVRAGWLVTVRTGLPGVVAVELRPPDCSRMPVPRPRAPARRLSPRNTHHPDTEGTP